MSSVIDFLLCRSSSPRLSLPAPTNDELECILDAAIRVPDHAALRPARFIIIKNERLNALGEIFEQSLIKRNPQATLSQIEKVRMAPLRAPMIIVVVSRISQHVKVPPLEQKLSAACSAYAILLAAEATGYAGIWRTGEMARAPEVADQLYIEENENIIGFIYLGTRVGEPKPLGKICSSDYVTVW